MVELKFFKWRLRITRGPKTIEMYTPEMLDWVRKMNKKNTPIGVG